MSEATLRSENGETDSSNVEQLHGGIGALMAQARERLGEELHDTARTLRINWSYIEAIEQSRFEKLPGRAYSVGFVRTYAEHLGLDPDEAVRRFKMESEGVQKDSELIFPEPIPESRMPGGSVVMIGAVIFIAAFVGWQLISGSGEPDLNVAAPPPKGFTKSVDAAASEPMPDPAATQPAPAAAPVTPVETAEAAPAPAPVPAPEPEAEPVQQAAVPDESAPAAAAPEPAPEQTQAAVVTVVPAAGAGILLRAKATSWVQVRDSDSGQTIITQVMRKGDEVKVPDVPGLVLLTGNAGALDILVDGVTAPAVGGSGQIVRNVVLQRDRLLAGTAAP